MYIIYIYTGLENEDTVLFAYLVTVPDMYVVLADLENQSTLIIRTFDRSQGIHITRAIARSSQLVRPGLTL